MSMQILQVTKLPVNQPLVISLDYLVMLLRGILILQSCTAGSIEAEFMAICEVGHNILRLARIFEEIIRPISYLLTLFEDSTVVKSICHC